MSKFQAFISDIDDTLLCNHQPMSERMASTLRRIGQQGVSVVLCSGRAGASIMPFVKMTGAEGEIICFNGARVIDLKTGETLVSNEVPVEAAREMLAWLRAHDCYAHYFEGDDFYCEEECEESRAYSKKAGLPPHYTHKPLAECVRVSAPKLLAIGSREKIMQLLPLAQKEFAGRLNVATSAPTFLEITAPEATKGNAVAKLAAARGWTKDTVICAGDGLNDLSMMQWTNWPVTVANAHPEVLKISRLVGKACAEDGMAQLLDELIPPEESR